MRTLLLLFMLYAGTVSAQTFSFECDPVVLKYGDITVSHELTSSSTFSGTKYYSFRLIIDSTKSEILPTDVYVIHNSGRYTNHNTFTGSWPASFVVGKLVNVYIYDPTIQEEGDYRKIGSFIIRT